MEDDCNWNVHKQDGFPFRSNSQKLLFTEKVWLIFVFHLLIIVVYFGSLFQLDKWRKSPH